MANSIRLAFYRQLGDRRRSRDAGVSLRRFGRTGDSRTHELRPALRPCAGQRRASRTAAYLGLSPAHFQCLILQSPAAFASSYVCIEAVLESADQHRRTEAAARLSDDGAVSFSCSAMAPHNEPVALALGRQFRERGGAPVGPATGVGPTLFDAAAQHVASRPHIINILPACSLKAPMAVGSVEGPALMCYFFLHWIGRLLCLQRFLRLISARRRCGPNKRPIGGQFSGVPQFVLSPCRYRAASLRHRMRSRMPKCTCSVVL